MFQRLKASRKIWYGRFVVCRPGPPEVTTKISPNTLSTKMISSSRAISMKRRRCGRVT
jgi:hypothetical protein